MVQEKFKYLISVNHSLQTQLKDANTAIEQKNAEIAFLRQTVPVDVQLKTRMDTQDKEMQRLHDKIDKSLQQTIGAGCREEELVGELEEAQELIAYYRDQKPQLAALKSENSDLKRQLDFLKERNAELEKAGRITGELQCKLDSALLENTYLQEGSVSAKPSVFLEKTKNKSFTINAKHS